MLTKILFLNTFHFSLTVFIAFTFFATGLLYFDSWQVDKEKKSPFIRSVGFFLLAFAEILYIVSLKIPYIDLVSQFTNLSGLSLIVYSLYIEPILKKPNASKILAILPFSLPALTLSLTPLSAVLTIIIALWYLRKSSEGMERQLRPASVAFGFLGLAKFVDISQLWSDTTNVFWSKILAEFGTVWTINHILLLIGTLILAIWVWGYIRFRLQIQMFTLTVGSSLVIFLATTFLFTFLLLKNLENDALSHLKTDVNILLYALNRQQIEGLSYAKSISKDPSFLEAFVKNDASKLYDTTSEFMYSQETDFLTVASSSGEVIIRAEDKEKIGDNISQDPLFISASKNNPLSTIVVKQGATYPEIEIRSASPIIIDGINEGVVTTGFLVDSAFVDGVKEATGLDVSVFADKIRSATTFTSSDGKSRFVGTTESNQKIINTVLSRGEAYIGSTTIFNQPYYTAYLPLKTLGDRIIGMLFVGKPQVTLMETAQKSIDSTFFGSIILILFSIAPAYYLSKYIKENISA